GAVVCRAGGLTVLVVEAARSGQLLRGVHGAGVRAVDLLVVTRPTTSTSAAVASLLARVPTRATVRPPDVRVAREVTVGGIALRLRPAEGSIAVDVARR